MTWVLVLHLMFTYTCKLGAACPTSYEQSRPFATVYRSLEACEEARVARQGLVALPMETEIRDVHFKVTKTLSCQPVTKG